jgi:hypothetical protein
VNWSYIKIKMLCKVLLPLLLVTMTLTSAQVNLPRSRHPVCIVGAGFTGLGIANLLQQQNIPVEVFEAKSRVGGKADTYRQGDEVLIEKCPLFFTRHSQFLLHYINKFNLTPISFEQKDQGGYDVDSGFIAPFPPLSHDEESVLMEAVGRFIQIRDNYTNEFDTPYLNVSPDLFVPFQEWLDRRNLSILAPLFVPVITTEGYGDLRDVPALYVLRLVSSREISTLVKDTFFTVEEGLDTLVNRMADGLDVHLGHKLTQIVRHGSSRQDLYFNFGSPQFVMKKCSKVVLAFPPLLVNLKSIIVRLSQEEREVLGDVKIHKYTTGGHHIPYFNQSLYVGVYKKPDLYGDSQPEFTLPRGRGEPVSLVKQTRVSDWDWIRETQMCHGLTKLRFDDAVVTRLVEMTFLRLGCNAARRNDSFTHM